MSLATALEEYLAPPQIVVLRGPGQRIAEWQRALAGAYRPATMVVGIARETGSLPAALDKPLPAGAGVNAWVCRGVTCLAPIGELAELERVIGERPLAA